MLWGGEGPEYEALGVRMMLNRGYLIAFEGIDGTGKSTQCGLLVSYLEQRGFSVLRLREPTDGPWGQKIRSLLKDGRGDVTPEEELQLFINDRREDVELNIEPALQDKKIVVIDRYYFSTAAYQGAIGFDPAAICKENESFAPRPDRVFIFTGSLDASFDRIREGRGEFSSFEKREYLEKVQKIFDSFEGEHVSRIDSDRSVEDVHKSIVDDVDRLLGISP